MEAIMKIDFLCPKCKGYLRVGDNIIFTTKTNLGGEGLLLLHPELGNYKSEHHPSIDFEDGGQIEFYCPICHSKLTSKHHDDLAMVLMKDETGQTFEVLFSRIAGEESTYCIIGESVEVFGKDSKAYLDFINLSLLS
jgi:hypothetical protein